MEMHSIRYFVALSETLNFSHAARKCRVTQPSMTRAIKKLEEELGGELFSRERSKAHLTELGRAMLPLLKQCHDSAVKARDLAVKHRRGEYTELKLVISQTITMELIADQLSQLNRALPELELEYVRGGADDIVEFLKQGEAELAIAGSLDEDWDRLDSWSLFEEDFVLAISECHPYVTDEFIELSQLRDIAIMTRPYCENYSDFLDLLKEKGIVLQRTQQISQDSDAIPLVKAGLGACVIPRSLGKGFGFRMIDIKETPLKRRVSLYSVAGRKRTAAAAALAGLLHAKDWSNAASGASLVLQKPATF